MISQQLVEILKSTTLNLAKITESDNFHTLMECMGQKEDELSDNMDEAVIQAIQSMDKVVSKANEINATDEELLTSFILSLAETKN